MYVLCRCTCDNVRVLHPYRCATTIGNLPAAVSHVHLSSPPYLLLTSYPCPHHHHHVPSFSNHIKCPHFVPFRLFPPSTHAILPRKHPSPDPLSSNAYVDLSLDHLNPFLTLSIIYTVTLF